MIAADHPNIVESNSYQESFGLSAHDAHIATGGLRRVVDDVATALAAEREEAQHAMEKNQNPFTGFGELSGDYTAEELPEFNQAPLPLSEQDQ